MANPANSVTVVFDILRELDYTSFTGSLVAVGTPFAYPVRMMKIINTSDVDLYISDDGLNNKDKIPAGSFELYDFCSNKTETGGSFLYPADTQIYVVPVSGSATKGSVSITVIYGANSY